MAVGDVSRKKPDNRAQEIQTPGLLASPSAGVGAKGVKIGVIGAFTGHYTSARLLAHFLELMDLDVVHSKRTTPAIISSGTTLASADLCVPFRVYVGHVHQLLADHPDITHLVAPNIWSEDGRCSTCAKYRDVGGVTLRSLSGTVSYLAARDAKFRRTMANLLGASASMLQQRPFPTLLMPNVHRLEPLEVRNLCYNVYADIQGWSPWRRALLFLPATLQRRWAPELLQVEAAASTALHDALRWRSDRLATALREVNRPRLVVAGRPYLVHDPALTCDLVNWFRRRGVCVITAQDVPPDELRRNEVAGFYDSHKEEEALVRWAVGKADGVICVGSFGCHPDSFQLDYLANLARQLGLACWSFRFDESAGQTGFQTRFATIQAFLEQRRDLRIGASNTTSSSTPLRVSTPLHVAEAPHNHNSRSAAPGTAPDTRLPLLTWPYMGDVLNVCMEEVAWQLGLQEYVLPPAPVTEQVMLLGNDRYTESCSPFACSTGSLRQSLQRILEAFGQAEAQGTPMSPRRVIMLMLHGEGPCTFGWYSMAQRTHLPAEFAERFAQGGHTVEMATAGMDGLADLARQLCSTGRSARLLAVLQALEALGHPRLGALQKPYLQLYLVRTLRHLARPVFAKLDAAERLRARSLVLRAHELQTGSVAVAYRKGLQLLQQAHSIPAIRAAEKQALQLLDSIPHDNQHKPRVVLVGEIYVMLTSFANRGATEHLLARAGLEVEEGITLGKFIRHSLHEMERRAICNLQPLRSVLAFLRRHNICLLQERLRDAKARPFLVHEVGGEGVPSVGAARRAVEAGCDGIVHMHPFKCMPEAIAKDALKELAELFNVRYLALSFDREVEIERLRTEIATYAAVLHAAGVAGGDVQRRRTIGRALDVAYKRYRRRRHTD